MLDTLLLFCFPLLLSLAAGWDVSSYTIPNWLNGALVILFFPIALIAGLDMNALGLHAAVGAGLLILGIALFAGRVIGGGDAKLLAAAGMWLGPTALLPFLFVTALAGGVLTIGIIFFRRLPLPAGLMRIDAVSRLHDAGGGIPYGVALAVAGLMAFPDSPLFQALT